MEQGKPRISLLWLSVFYWERLSLLSQYIHLSWECMFLGSLSRHNKYLEWRTLKPPWHVTALRSWRDRVIALRSRMGHVIPLRQISVTALFYLEDSRKIHPRSMRACQPKDLKRREWRSTWGRERERERAHALGGRGKRFGFSFYMFFLPPGPALCKLGLARSAVCSTWGLHSSPRTFLWPSLFFSHHHFGLLFPILPT